eukprot:7599426-Alexandrium_andersonii.AAC.1
MLSTSSLNSTTTWCEARLWPPIAKPNESTMQLHEQLQRACTACMRAGRNDATPAKRCRGGACAYHRAAPRVETK